jgi:hypothetical protein
LLLLLLLPSPLLLLLFMHLFAADVRIVHQASEEDNSAVEKGSGGSNWALKYVLNKARESVNKLVKKDEAAPEPEGMKGNIS